VSWFGRKLMAIDKTPKIGEQYKLNLDDDDQDPFEPTKGSTLSTITEVKEGWVRYCMGSGFLFPDNRMRIDRFLRIYQKVNPPPSIPGKPMGVADTL